MNITVLKQMIKDIKANKDKKFTCDRQLLIATLELILNTKDEGEQK